MQEMMALEWTDVDLGKRQLCVQSEWKGHGQHPRVPAAICPAHGAARVAPAITSFEGIQFCEHDGSPLTMGVAGCGRRRAG